MVTFMPLRNVTAAIVAVRVELAVESSREPRHGDAAARRPSASSGAIV
jgi:hypothetical protein